MKHQLAAIHVDRGAYGQGNLGVAFVGTMNRAEPGFAPVVPTDGFEIRVAPPDVLETWFAAELVGAVAELPFGDRVKKLVERFVAYAL